MIYSDPINSYHRPSWLKWGKVKVSSLSCLSPVWVSTQMYTEFMLRVCHWYPHSIARRFFIQDTIFFSSSSPTAFWLRSFLPRRPSAYVYGKRCEWKHWQKACHPDDKSLRKFSSFLHTLTHKEVKYNKKPWLSLYEENIIWKIYSICSL